MSVLKYYRRMSGVITAVRDGKIVGNIGKGKTKIPTASQNMNVTQKNTVEENPTIAKMKEKFDNLQEDLIKHPNYLEYQEEMRNTFPFNEMEDENDRWVATIKTLKGRKRMEWAEPIAEREGIFKNERKQPGWRAKLMLSIHPFGEKPCANCGDTMSLFYVYLNQNLIKKINNVFGLDMAITDTLDDFIIFAREEGASDIELISFLKEVSNIHDEFDKPEDLIPIMEKQCREEGKRYVGPGAASNFPDRFDGFHDYNRCCRSEKDLGRSPENMRTYGDDRRACENLSDGNLGKADKYVRSKEFENMTADHIGPVSLGFKHDVINLTPMSGVDNSAKNNNLIASDVEKLIQCEKDNSTTAASWFIERIWNHCKDNYTVDNLDKYKDALQDQGLLYRLTLNDLMKQGGPKTQTYMKQKLFKKHLDDCNFAYSYDDEGIISKRLRKSLTQIRKTKSTFLRRTIRAIKKSAEKENRRSASRVNEIFDQEKFREQRKTIANHIRKGEYDTAHNLVEKLIQNFQEALIHRLETDSSFS